MFGKRSQDGFAEVLPGIRIKTIVHGRASLMTEFLLQAGAQLPFHAHAQEQTGYLIEGRIELHIGERHRVMNPGDSWCIPAHVSHSAEILEDSRALEVFAPLREDYLQYLWAEDRLDGALQ